MAEQFWRHLGSEDIHFDYTLAYDSAVRTRGYVGESMTRFIAVCSGFLFLGVDWCLSALILWWSYDIGAQIRGGVYSRNQALSLVFKMGLITTILTGLAWLFVRRSRKVDQWSLMVWSVIWRTALLEIGYAFLVVARRQLWKPNQGLGDSNMFLPIVGHLNAQFFAEWKWLSFLLLVVPAVGVISGILYYLHVKASMLYERRA